MTLAQWESSPWKYRLKYGFRGLHIRTALDHLANLHFVLELQFVHFIKGLISASCSLAQYFWRDQFNLSHQCASRSLQHIHIRVKIDIRNTIVVFSIKLWMIKLWRILFRLCPMKSAVFIIRLCILDTLPDFARISVLIKTLLYS